MIAPQPRRSWPPPRNPPSGSAGTPTTFGPLPQPSARPWLDPSAARQAVTSPQRYRPPPQCPEVGRNSGLLSWLLVVTSDELPPMAQPRVAAGALFLDAAGRILLLMTTYKD